MIIHTAGAARARRARARRAVAAARYTFLSLHTWFHSRIVHGSTGRKTGLSSSRPPRPRPAGMVVHGVYCVKVGNLGPAATEEDLREFFGFCGTVVGVQFEPVAELQQAVVSFDTIAAQETAILLTEALLIGRPIAISKHVDGHVADTTYADATYGAPASQGTMPADAPVDAPADAAAAPAGETDGGESSARYASLHGLLDAGYLLGQRALGFMAEFEERHGVGRTLSEVGATILTKVKEVDENLQVSAKVKRFDDEHEISLRTAAAWTSAKEQSKAAVEAAKPVVAAAAESIKAGAQVASAKAGELGREASSSLNAAKERVQADGRVQQGWAQASTAAAGVSAWASALASLAKEKVAEMSHPTPPPPR